MQRLIGLIDPNELAGSVIVVHAANVPAFFGRTIYVGPGRREKPQSFLSRES